MSEPKAGSWEIRPLDPSDPKALDRFIPLARGGIAESASGPGASELVQAWKRRTLAPGTIVRVLVAQGEIHGVVAARPAGLVIDGQSVRAYHVIELAVDAHGRGGAVALARDLLSLPHLFYGAANVRVERLWRRVGSDRYRSVAPIRVLEIRPRRRLFRRSPVVALAAPDRLRAVPGARVYNDDAGPPCFSGEEGWLGIDGDALLHWAIHPSTDGPLLVARDFRAGARETACRQDLLNALADLAYQTRAARTLLPVLEGDGAAELLQFRGVSVAPGWDPGPVLVFHEGTRSVDISVIEHASAWHSPGWLPL